VWLQTTRQRPRLMVGKTKKPRRQGRPDTSSASAPAEDGAGGAARRPGAAPA
jgi:hypothetical protein